MSEMENPHNYRKVGYSMILVAASLTAIGLLHLAIGENVLYGDQIQRDKTAFFDVPKNVLILRFCLIHLKNNSICQRAL